MITSTQIIGTSITVYAVWEPTISPVEGSQHHTVQNIDGRWYGRVGTRRDLPEAINSLDVGPARIAAVKGWYAAQYEEAYTLIVAQHPEVTSGRRDMGEIEIVTK